MGATLGKSGDKGADIAAVCAMNEIYGVNTVNWPFLGGPP